MRSELKVLFAFLLLIAIAWATPASVADMLVVGRVDDAVKALTDRLQAQPNDAEAFHLLSRANFHLRKWDKAIEYGEKAVQLAPNNSQYYLWLGRAYGEKADDSGPLTAARIAGRIRGNFEKAVLLDPNNVDARCDLAEYYLEAPGFMGGGTDKAAEQARQLVSLDPAKAHWVNARIAEKQKDYGTALREYNEAIKSGQSASYWLNLASYYRRRKQYDDMQSTIDKALAAPRKKSNDYFDAATLLYRAGRNLDGAANLVRTYLTTAKPNEEAPIFEAHYLLGQIFEKQGNKAAAADEYRTSLSLASNYGPAQEALKRVAG
jgi:tetratricopeptide (TPR) repeat protein